MSGEKIGIVGSGLIGRAWAMLFAAAGYRVCMYDIEPIQISDALKELQNELASLEERGKLRGTLNAHQQYESISTTSDIKVLVEDAQHIQECIPERIDWKKSLYEQLDAIVGEHTIISSSTSTFMPSLFTAGLLHKGNMLVAHPLNPPYHIPLVEIVPASWTRPEAIARTHALMLQIGQKPVVLGREVQGFATNRIQYAILNEVWHLIEDGIISVADVDSVMTDGLGLRYAFLGPIETAHLNADGVADYVARFGSEIYAVSQTYGPTPNMQDATSTTTLANIAQQCERLVPRDRLAERRTERDTFLMELAALKRQFPKS